MSTALPIIGISMGDPYGNGPELSIKALSHPEVYAKCRPLIIGDAAPMRYAQRVLELVCGLTINLHFISSVNEALFTPGTVDVLTLGLIGEEDYPSLPLSKEAVHPLGIGSTEKGGEAGFRYVEKLIQLALAKEVDGTVTNAISKEAINMAGHHYSGHTEIYADYTHTKQYAMMLAHDNLRVIHVSTHVSLREACDRVKKDRVLTCIRLAHKACCQLGIENPKIGVAGLNPHCGEGGLFGREEIEEIQPAIDAALAEGINVPDKKPAPADTIFSKALGGWYDMVVVMYHDQGHIPLKVKGFVYDRDAKQWEAVSGVNITLGLPIVRVSVDHGTGFDQAGNGLCSEASLMNSIDYAIVLR